MSNSENAPIVRIFFLCLLAFSLLTLSTAFFIDIVLGFDPCILCLYARIPYVIMIIISIAALSFNKINAKYLLFAALLTSILALSLAIYHTGVELHLWESAMKCSSEVMLEENTSLEEFKKSLENAKIADCSKPAFTILGFSLAQINILINGIITILVLWVIRKNAKTSV
ncbi:MAG: disulfide bond formation protein B [Rickettsiaceae bacterium]|nr:disulfide bond formation protein B [Rickettsiaceae bacterium]